MSPDLSKRLVGWRLAGTTKWCPLWMGPPPDAPGLTWEPIYR